MIGRFPSRLVPFHGRSKRRRQRSNITEAGRRLLRPLGRQESHLFNRWESNLQVAVGTFNLNNLFSRFNFRGEVTALPEQPPIEFTSTFELPEATMNAFTKRRVPLLKTALTHDETKARKALALYLRGWEAVYPGSSAELLD